jgi:hypothetical protein
MGLEKMSIISRISCVRGKQLPVREHKAPCLHRRPICNSISGRVCAFEGTHGLSLNRGLQLEV